MRSTYQVLAIRCRPRKLEDIFGQPTAVNAIRGFLKTGKVPQTILLSGPYGSGKTTLARIIARYVNCLNPTKVEGYVYGDPCGLCSSCKELDKTDSNHPDVHEINAATERGIDNVRGWIRQSKYKPQSNFRVFIIDEVHALTGDAASAFLKPSEEPSRSAMWILCTTEPGRLMHTSRSRTLPIKVNPVSLEDCTHLLASIATKEGFHVPEDHKVLLKIAESVRGHPREALQLLESVMNVYEILDKSDLDLDKIVTDAAEEIVGDTSDVAVCNYLISLYQGKFTIPLSVLQRVDNPQLFLDSVMRFHMQTMRYSVAKKLADKYYVDYYNKLKAANLLPKCATPAELQAVTGPYRILELDALSLITEQIFQALTQIKQYMVDPYVILFRMTSLAVLNVQNSINLITPTKVDGVSNGSNGHSEAEAH